MKGNLLIGQSGGPTAVINASLAGAIEAAKERKEIAHILGSLHGMEGILGERFVDLRQEDEPTLLALRNTPAAALGSCRYKLRPGDLTRALRIFEKYDIRYFLYIGGNDSADTSHQLAVAAEQIGYDLKVIGIPKTIDNDLPITDHCPGYGSIARFVALATKDAGMDTEAMRHIDPIKIIEVMGRNAGWVAAASALGKTSAADAPHLIYLPERPLRKDQFLTDVERTYNDNSGFAVIVVPETIRDEHGQPLASNGSHSVADDFGHPRLTGAGESLCQLIGSELGLKARWDKPGTIQRMSMACASEVDLNEAYQVGQEATRYALEGHTDSMVVIIRQPGPDYSCAFGMAPLTKIANTEKLLPDEFINAQGNFVTPAFHDYALPLIGDPLPAYARLRKVPFRLPTTS